MSNTQVYVEQRAENTASTSYDYFKKTIGANGRECCHYSNKSCNKSRDPNQTLLMHIVIADNHYGINFPAGGSIEITEQDGVIYFGTFQADGTWFPFENFDFSS
ncbi:hypothetical protein BD408DRAFT_446174 [Parasitella parasitica]|nr:hypothetical protein BD408DRAFT_446174 [Parasitella parasitica]